MKVDGEAQHAVPLPKTENMKTRVELSKLFLKRLSGDPLELNQFRETYKAGIHQNTKILNLKKFSYLLNYLNSSAK